MRSDTIKTLAAITDEGLFEQLALAVLQTADPLCEGLSQQGGNASGKTKPSPVDNMGFVRGASPPHMVIAHHTTAGARDLRAKWLGANAGRSGRSAAPRKSDIEKSARIINEERSRTPELQATLFLTTNQEPDETLVRDVAAASARLGFAIDIWSRVRLAGVLDTDPTGQWIRATLLHIEQEWVSSDLLTEISRESIDEYVRPEAARQWVARALDRQLATNHRNPTFILGASGAGKSVACLKALARHVEGGGYALVLPHGIVESAPTLNAALLATLQRYRPSLRSHIAPLSVCSAERTFLLLVEDINHAANPAAIMEKVLRWSADAAKDGATGDWRLLCPLWQRTLNRASDTVRREVEGLSLVPEPLTAIEATQALRAKAEAGGYAISDLEAHAQSAALGHDPLLIGLYEAEADSVPSEVIAHFVECSLDRCEALRGRPAGELRAALLHLGEQMLNRRILTPVWSDMTSWRLPPTTLESLRDIAMHGELLWLGGRSSRQGVTFRHDRVRDHLLTEAAVQLYDAECLSDAVLNDPYFSEIVARMLVARSASDLPARMCSANPLALFQALRIALPHAPSLSVFEALAADWISNVANRGADKGAIRRTIAAVLLECDGPVIPQLVRLLPESPRTARLSRLRNGELDGGIEDCLSRNLYSVDIWRKRQIDQAKPRHGEAMCEILEARLRDPATPGNVRGALLNLAGDFADPRLAPAIQTSWQQDPNRGTRLDDYLWALSYCCTEATAAGLLAPICDAWAALPQERNGGTPSPRDDLVGDSIRWAFERNPPGPALEFLAGRGRSDDLAWQIYYMMHGIDHSVAIAFCVDAMARARLTLLDWYTVNFRKGADVWERRRDEYGEYMSVASGTLLRGWWQDQAEDEHRRVAAFDLWAASWREDDLLQLRAWQDDPLLGDRVLRQRLRRSDATAIPQLIGKLDGETGAHWWYHAGDLWSPALTAALERAYARLAGDSAADPNSNISFALAETIVRLSAATAEPILLRYERALSRSPRYVQCALYFATPQLLAVAARAISNAREPKAMFKLLTSHFGIRHRGHPGVTRREQIRGLAPYLHLMDEHDRDWFADACNDAGWFDLRRELFDPLHPDSRNCWTVERLPALFDRLASDRHFVSHEIEAVLKAGVTWADVASALARWLSQRNDEDALALAGEILDDRGYRRDLTLLASWPGAESDTSEAIIANTEFSVCLRTAA